MAGIYNDIEMHRNLWKFHKFGLQVKVGSAFTQSSYRLVEKSGHSGHGVTFG